MTEQNFDAMRQAMVASQLRTNEVNDPRVIAAIAAVPRERFVPADRAAVAYIDRPVPLNARRALNTPMATSRLIVELETRPTDRALVIGAGSGYAAAILARLTASVTALEEDESLAGLATAELSGVETVIGPLVEGHAAGAPYDVILIDGAVERIPAAIIDQLADGGRIAAAIVDNGVTRLTVGRKSGGAVGLRAFADADAAPLPGFAEPPSFKF
ncbi:protein-L-isoaspartate O-methyltransferase family protein [Sphingomonas sp. ID0503]|uniref:protein-L-isoaspartate O-methyltransferase family protein n=1 Tax=Sphingomonas sp. ID0503 TaxID=3399691 RepID=UPI003AFA53EC